MLIAYITSKRSKDPNSQVGACIVSDDNYLLSTGYNGTPKGYSDDLFPWGKESNKELENKYLYVVHSELNSILNFKGNNDKLKNSKIYVTLFPCNDCAKVIIQSGIKEVIYLSDKYHDSKEAIAARKLFNECGDSYRHIDLDKKIKIL